MERHAGFAQGRDQHLIVAEIVWEERAGAGSTRRIDPSGNSSRH